MVAPTCFDITLPSSGSFPSAVCPVAMSSKEYSCSRWNAGSERTNGLEFHMLCVAYVAAPATRRSLYLGGGGVLLCVSNGV
jgi:hypothetical protein